MAKRAQEIFPMLKADGLPVEVYRATDNSGTWISNSYRTAFVSNADQFGGQWLYYSDNVREALRSFGLTVFE